MVLFSLAVVVSLQPWKEKKNAFKLFFFFFLISHFLGKSRSQVEHLTNAELGKAHQLDVVWYFRSLNSRSLKKINTWI